MKKRRLSISTGFILLLGITTAMGMIHRRDSEPTAKNLIPWRHDYQIARAEALSQHKTIFVEFMASWCPDCANLARTTWSDPAAVNVLSTYVPVQIDLDANPTIAEKYHVEAIPTLLLIDPETQQVQKELREQTPTADALNAWLKSK